MSLQRLFKFAAALAVLLVPVLAFAQASSMPADLPVDQALDQAIKVIGGMKGMGALGIAVSVVQLLLLALRSPVGNLAGKYKLLIVGGLSIVATYLALVASGASWGVALITGPVIAAVQVFAHQIYVQFKGEPPEAQ